jgi:hypothetical protein
MNKPLPKTKPSGAKNLKLDSADTEKANRLTGSAFPATAVVDAYLSTSVNPAAVMQELLQQAADVQRGDMSAIEGMLVNQAVALQSIFVDLALQAKKQKSLSGTQTLTQLALKAQAGCRSTLQTLADVKNPRQVSFVKQTNLAHTQQVNNGVQAPSRGGKHAIVPNELLEDNSDGSTHMDNRATTATERAHPDVVAVGKVHWPNQSRRQARVGT